MPRSQPKSGGILNSARKLNDASEDELFNLAWDRLTTLSRIGYRRNRDQKRIWTHRAGAN